MPSRAAIDHRIISEVKKNEGTLLVMPAIPGTEIWGPVAGSTPDGGTIIPFDEEMMQRDCSKVAKIGEAIKDGFHAAIEIL